MAIAYNCRMPIPEQIQKDMTAAMKAREELRLSALRMVRAALKNREIEKRAPLTDAEALQVLEKLVKQRRDSVEQFTKGNRQDLADKEAAEITLIESYMPRGMSEDDLAALVRSSIAEMGSASGSTPGMKEMGQVMKNVMGKIAATGARADGKTVSELVKRELGGK